MPRDLLFRIQAAIPEMSKGQKLIANYILEHYDKAAFYTALKLGQTVGVSESTVVRFATLIGYEGYPELQNKLQELIRNKLTSVQRFEMADTQIGTEDILQKVLTQDIEKIKRTLETTSRVDFAQAIDSILAARKLYILGVRSSGALANFLGFYLNLMFENVQIVHASTSSEVFEQIMRVSKEDAVIGISFPRYSKQTCKAMTFASSVGADVIAITDSRTAPIAEVSKYVLIAASNVVSVVDSLTAPLSLINALIVALGQKRRTEVAEAFTRLERIWEEYEIYEKSDE